MRRHRPLILVACSLALALLSTASAQTTARIDTVAGGGAAGFSGDGAAATNALLTAPSDVAFLGGTSTYLIADTSNNRIRRVDDTGTITTVAGAGASGCAGGG